MQIAEIRSAPPIDESIAMVAPRPGHTDGKRDKIKDETQTDPDYDRIAMTTANKITILRIVLIPFFVVEMIYYLRTGNEAYRLAGVLSFATAAILDGVDGYVARHYHQTSELGTVLDPLADKLLLVSAIVFLNLDNSPYLRSIPLWLTGVIIGRDILLGIGAVVIRLMVGKVVVKPHLTGKIATVFQMVVVAWILMRWDIGLGLLNELILGAGLFTGVSGLFYLWDGMQQLAEHPSSSAPKKPS